MKRKGLWLQACLWGVKKMQIGLLYPVKDQIKAENELNKGKAVLGIDVHSLLDELNSLCCKHGFDCNLALAELLAALMQVTGKIKVESKQEGDNVGTD